MTSIHARAALLPGGMAEDVRLRLADGRIAEVAPGVAPLPGDERVGLVLPGMANLHSHAFQRAMAGLTELRGPGADSFWTWREAMYRLALALDPDQAEAIAAQLYVEMLEAGFTRVGEFHYLHHDRDGRPYADVAEMGASVLAAAAATGIGMTLLPVFYAHAGFGGTAPAAGQRRFVCDLDGYARLVDASARHAAGVPGAMLGLAPHSLRAATAEELAAVARLRPGAPLHIHIAEQEKEVADCIAWSGARPVQWLLDHQPVGPRWCLVHATHMTPAETTAMARSGAVAGLCPITEANLGDGIFAGQDFVAAGGRYGVGSDSNVAVSLAGELRQLEYSQRLRERARNVLAAPGAATGTALFQAALAGGAQALGQGGAGLAAGAAADVVAIDVASPQFAAMPARHLPDAWVFAGQGAVDRVWVAGRKLVADGRHVGAGPIAARFRRVMTALAG